jgi:type III secretion system chaperone SycN
MSWVHDTLSEYGRQNGLSDLGFGSYGVAQLVFQSGDVLAVEPVSRGDIEEVLVYVSRPLGFDGSRLLRRALIKAHFREAGALDIQVSSRGQGPALTLLALVRMPARDFTLQALDHAFDYLNRWLAGLSA